MKDKSKKILSAVMFITLLAFLGCAHTESTNVSDLERQLDQKNKELQTLESSNQEKEMLLEKYKGKLDDQSRAALDAEMRAEKAKAELEIAKSPAAVSPQVVLLPPEAKPGECYARVFVPPTYKTVSENVLKRGASERLEVIPAKYQWVEEKVLVEEASERLEVIPAKYQLVEEKVLVKQASTRMEQVPATYKWEEERILVKPAHSVWKKGRGPIEKVDYATGEIMCLVEIPASYKTVKKRVMVSPPTTRSVDIPAEYKTVKKNVMVKPPTTRKIEIPAVYKAVKVRKLVSPPKQRSIQIPAEYQTVTKTEKVSEGQMAWRRILCETNVSKGVITRVQMSLKSAGYNPGPIDGVLGWRTTAAMKSYQKSKGLAVGELTHETIQSLGIKL